MGFVIERAYLPVDYSTEELKVAVSIAFGHHGFGELFSNDLPFIIIALAKDTAGLESAKNEIAKIFESDKNFKEGKIKIDGVVV